MYYHINFGVFLFLLALGVLGSVFWRLFLLAEHKTKFHNDLLAWNESMYDKRSRRMFLCLRKVTIERLSLFVQYWQLAGTAFLPIVPAWRRGDHMMSWFPEAMTFLLQQQLWPWVRI